MANNQVVDNSALNKQEKLFIRYLARGERPSSAASHAGYGSAKDVAERLTTLSRIQNALKMALTVQFKTDDAPRARRVIRDLMDDLETPRKLRLECAKLLLNRGGYVEQKSILVKDPSDKNPSEMTGAELQAHIARLQGEIGNRALGARVIEGVVLGSTSKQDTQDIDILG